MKKETITYECDACKKTVTRLKNGTVDGEDGGEWRILHIRVLLIGGKAERCTTGHACSSECADKVAAMLLRQKSKSRAV